MIANLLPWIVLAPLAGAAVNGFLGRRIPKGVVGIVGCAGPALSLALSCLVVRKVWSEGPVHFRDTLAWITTDTFSVEFGFTADALACVMLLVVTGVGTLIHVYSIGYMRGDAGIARFFAYLNLFMFAMLTLVLADNLVLMFLGWEGVGLCSYLLIGFWYEDLKNADAGKKAFITNRVGDFGFVLGLFMLFWQAGTLNVRDLQLVSALGRLDPGLLYWPALLLFLGACGKSAQIPLYVWLPDAMAGPTPVSALIHAATMVTAGVYMIGRLHFVFAAVPEAMGIIALVCGATALLAGVIAVAQNDIKKVLAYSTISQLGFMFCGMASTQFTTGMFHVVTHAFFKALLFLGAGAVIHALHGEQDIRKMGGLFRKLPALGVVFIVGGLALAGMPGLSGFVSKDAILAAVHERSVFSQLGIAWVLLVLTAGVTAFYTTRLMLVVFFGEPREHGASTEAGAVEHHELHKPGLTMMVPLYVLAFLSLAGGLALQGPVERFLGRDFHGGDPAAVAEARAKAFAAGTEESEHRIAVLGMAAVEPLRRAASAAPGDRAGRMRRLADRIDHGHHFHVMLSSGVFLAGFGLAWLLYVGKRDPDAEAPLRAAAPGRAAYVKQWLAYAFTRDWPRAFAEGAGAPVYKAVVNKFWVDELYQGLVVTPIRVGAALLWFVVDRLIIDAILVGGPGWLAYRLGAGVRRLHTGSIAVAVALLVLGAAAVVGFDIIVRFFK